MEKREPHKTYQLSSLSSFFSHKICFYSDKCLNGSSSGISLLSITSMFEAFSKANLIILPESRNLSYRLIRHHACIAFIFDNFVSISISWKFFLLFSPFFTSFAHHSCNHDFRNNSANTFRSRGWKIWVKFGGTCTQATLFSSRCSRYLSVVYTLKTS